MQHYSFIVPSVWESARRIRFGIDTAVLTLRFTDRSEAVLTQMIRTGVSAAALHAAAAKLDASELLVASLLQRLTPVLTPPGREPLVFSMYDDFHTGPRIAAALTRKGCIWRQRTREPHTTTTVAVTIERFGYNPARNAMLCSRGHPVLPVRFTDRTVSIGPILDETTLCTHCMYLDDVDSQAPWIRWADQLIGVPIPAESILPAGVLAAFVSEVLGADPESNTGTERIVVTYSLSGKIEQVHRETLQQHPSCDRHALQELLVPEQTQHVA